MDDLDLDPRVEALVGVLNELPGVFTRSSCGGHEDLEDRVCSARPADEFYVAFDVEPGMAAWRALDQIAWAVSRYVDEDPGCDPEDVDLVVWSDNDPDAPAYDGSHMTFSFEINGRNGADPDILAGIIALAAGLQD